MASPVSTYHLLKIETLEDRTLLASDLDWADAAIQGDVDYKIDIIWVPGNSQVRVQGENSGSVSINVDFFPEESISLSVSSFSDVTIVGEADLDFLYAVDIINLSVGIDLTNLLSTNEVERITLTSGPPMLILQGAYTLIEIDDLTNVFILSDLNTLDLSTTNPNSGLSLLSLNAGRTVRANFEPDSPYTPGFENPQILFITVFEKPNELLSEDLEVSNDFGFVNPEFLVAERFLSLEEVLRNSDPVSADTGEAWLEHNEIPLTGFFSDTETVEPQILNDNGQLLPPYMHADASSHEYVDTFLGYNPALSDRADSAKSDEFMVYLSDLIGREGELTPDQEETAKRHAEQQAQDLNLAHAANPQTPSGGENDRPIIQAQDSVFRSWLEIMTERFEKVYRKTQNLAVALKVYLAQQITDELTPGERTGLIVNTHTPRNNYKHIDPA